jgi:opacity protein-like surface antigen
MFYKKALFAVVFCSFFAANAKAQVWELGLQAGGAGYMGDLNPTNPLKISGLSLGGFARANFDPNWALSLNYINGNIKADDAKSPYPEFRQRNLSFHTKLHEISLLVDFNFFDYFSGGGFSRFSPYLYAGAGVTLFNPKTYYNDDEYELKWYLTEGQTESYRTFAMNIPFGAGVKYNFKEGWSLIGNIGYRNAYTDYLDDVSGLYPDQAALSSDPSISTMQRILADRSGEKTGNYTGIANTQRGDFRKRDTYMFVGIGITYTFVSQKCF